MASTRIQIFQQQNPKRKCVIMNVRDVIKSLEQDGWYLVRTRGSHRQFKHSTKPGVVTIAGHPSKDLSPDTLRSIWRQAQLGDKP